MCCALHGSRLECKKRCEIQSVLLHRCALKGKTNKRKECKARLEPARDSAAKVLGIRDLSQYS